MNIRNWHSRTQQLVIKYSQDEECTLDSVHYDSWEEHFPEDSEKQYLFHLTRVLTSRLDGGLKDWRDGKRNDDDLIKETEEVLGIYRHFEFILGYLPEYASDIVKQFELNLRFYKM